MYIITSLTIIDMNFNFNPLVRDDHTHLVSGFHMHTANSNSMLNPIPYTHIFSQSSFCLFSPGSRGYICTYTHTNIGHTIKSVTFSLNKKPLGGSGLLRSSTTSGPAEAKYLTLACRVISGLHLVKTCLKAAIFCL